MPNLSEAGLRKKIKERLKANKRVVRIKDTHGSSEYGLDLVFLYLDAFNHPRAYGIQIKKGNIKCSGKPTLRVKEIIGQLSIAFGKEESFDDVSYKMEGFYVITNGDINEAATRYIDAARCGFHCLHFIDGQALTEYLTGETPKIELFKET